ncbi:zinc finger MYM-type protein 1-like [Pseudochaenichthys georgianus]|uniref:zinc finger MYM-type protein 1-like n=1 Tax=Pseudochaenichthys georgianus TaxID=52239 RepID=UPI0039C4A714
MAKFDPVRKQHVGRVESGAGSHTHYMGKRIQNELIDSISSKILDTIVEEIKRCKYFSIILDYTPDLSHKEQLSVIVRIVSLEDKPQVKEHFLGFLVAEQSTGERLTLLILKRLGELNIPFEDCRGQSYDNGANMKGENKGVQARLLQQNPRAFCVPCGAHTLNLVVAEAAKSSPDAIGYFGYLTKLYKLFSASTHRWDILLKHVKTTLKSWSETRWESRIKSVEAVKYQAGQIREALLEVRETTADPVVRVEAQSLAEEIGSYRFIICTTIWYDILYKIQHVSKLMQSPSMQLDVAVDLLKKTGDSLTCYRRTGFSDAQTTAKEMCEEMNVESVLKQKRLRSTKRQFGYESPDEPIDDALKNMEITFFNVVVDTALSSLDERFQHLEEVNNKFGVLINFPTTSNEELSKHCQTLSSALTHDGQPDIDGRELAAEMQNVPHLPSKKMTNMELLTFLHEKKLTEMYPNLWVALRISATLPVTVAAAERSFSKLKLVKTYI